jgi:hypothetical protein
MEPDEKTLKGTAVTKPIELRAKKGAAPRQAKLEKSQSSDRREVTAPAAVSMISPGRGRKSAQKPEIIDQIGQRLRTVYNSVLVQPIPDRFHDLLRELEAGAAPAGGGLESLDGSGKSKDSKSKDSK